MIASTWLGRAPYRQVWAQQEAVRDQVLAGGAEHILFCEHDPVITLGRSGDDRHILDAGDVEVVRTSRGGDVTAHGPGQLVIYPIVRLRGGVRRYMDTVGGAIAQELGDRGVPARWTCAPAGVWVGPDKVAACGVHVKRGIAVHGFAINVTTESLALFRRIIPCGLTTKVTCVEHHAAAPALADLAAALGSRLSRALRRNDHVALDLPCDHARSR
jgi:lipoyl(octanoyl) transferase